MKIAHRARGNTHLSLSAALQWAPIRGHAVSPHSTLRRHVARHRLVVVINEFNTSKRLLRLLGILGWRRVWSSSCESRRTRECACAVRAIDRDVAAAFNIARIALSALRAKSAHPSSARHVGGGRRLSAARTAHVNFSEPKRLQSIL